MHPQFTEREIARFWSRVDKSDRCWLHPGTPSQRYATLLMGGSVLGAHVVSFIIHHGAVPAGMYVCHSCNVKRCVRPDHLYLGTPKENAMDASRDGLYPTGDRHWSRTKPERLARGERTGMYTHPESRTFGDRNGLRRHPERVARGQKHPKHKLTLEDALEIYQRHMSGGVLQRVLAAEYGVDQTLISHIVTRKSWPELDGLIATP